MGAIQKVSLPRRDSTYGYQLSFLKDAACAVDFTDTKGVDLSAIRPDLQAYLDDDRTISIICSRFTPDSTMLDLLAHLAATGKGATISERVVFLVLTRRDEALALSNEDGTPIENVEDAYALREAQIRSKLARLPGGKLVPILFFDAAMESPDKIVSKLKEKLDALREGQVTRVQEIVSATDDLVSKHQQQQTQVAFAKLRAKLREFSDQYRELSGKTMEAHNHMLYAMRNLHPRTVWACVSRQGEWTNLNAYLWADRVPTLMPRKRSEKAKDRAFDTLINTFLGDAECAAIHNHLVVLKGDVATWGLKFLDEVGRRSQEIFRAAMFPEAVLWNTCKRYWPQGDSFRVRVSNEIQQWLADKDHEWIPEAVEGIIRKDWQDFYIGRIQDMCKEPATTRTLTGGLPVAAPTSA